MRDNDKQSDIIDNKNAITLKEWKDTIDDCVGQKKADIIDSCAVEEYKDVIVGQQRKRYLWQVQHLIPDSNRQSPKMRK